MNETWRRVTILLERCPRLEIQIANLTVGMQNLGHQHQNECQAHQACRNRLRETEAALRVAEGTRDHFEELARSACKNKERLEVALKESSRNGQELEDTREDLFNIKQQLQQLHTVKAEGEASALLEKVALQEENERLQDKIDGLEQKLLNHTALWHQDYARAETLNNEVEAFRRAASATITVQPYWRSHSLSPEHRLAKRHKPHAQATNTENTPDSDDAEMPLLTHCTSEVDEAEIDKHWP